MFLWDIAPWMRQTTQQLNDIIHRIDAVQSELTVIANLLVNTKLSPEQQQTLNEIYTRSIATRAKMEAVQQSAPGGSPATKTKG